MKVYRSLGYGNWNYSIEELVCLFCFFVLQGMHVGRINIIERNRRLYMVINIVSNEDDLALSSYSCIPSTN